ncbi:MAG: MinD/ParA family protein [Anaerohalosphaeraceae bacterium]|nr:MinD/ParA family protein [Anaerohalosphaeraceae bacterium]
MDRVETEANIEKLAKMAADKKSSATVITIASGKGGVGKTNISANLAICLSAMGKKVVVFDADIGLANLDVIMGVNAKYNLSHFLKGRRSLDEVCTSTASGVDVICGIAGVDGIAEMDEFKRQRLMGELDILAGNYDVIIVDTAAGIGKTVMAFCQAADHTLLVTTPEPTAITDVYILIKAMTARGYQGRTSLLVNMADSADEGRKVYRQIAAAAEQFLNVHLNNAGILTRDSHVGAAVRKREPLVLAYPKCSATQSLLTVAARLSKTPVARDEGFFRKVVNWFF